VSLTIPAGRTVALVGHTGAGKSTLLSLLLRLSDPPPGTIFLDDRDVRTYTMSGLRRRFGVVPQETFLFSASVADNIAFGVRAGHTRGHRMGGPRGAPRGRRPGLSAAASRPWSANRGITHFRRAEAAHGHPRARCLRRPAILLLDDCLSSVDTTPRRRSCAELMGVMKSRTSILGYPPPFRPVRHADTIVVLDEGRIAEQGTHDSRCSRSAGSTPSSIAAQQLEEELEAS
jgi:ATP-binding cassette subfamily B protein